MIPIESGHLLFGERELGGVTQIWLIVCLLDPLHRGGSEANGTIIHGYDSRNTAEILRLSWGGKPSPRAVALIYAQTTRSRRQVISGAGRVSLKPFVDLW